VEIPGTVPPLDALPPGCAYATRCPLADEVCRSVPPALEIVQPGHSVACWHAARAEEIAA
jgi:oligopeptide/dipeptide ABC transporter ATP-binding protein